MEKGDKPAREQVGVMRAKKRHSILAILWILAIGIPGSIRIFVVQAESFAHSSESANMIQVADTLSPTSTQALQTSTPLFLTSTSSPLSGASLPSGPLSANLYAYIQAPSGPVQRPYVILRAFSTAPTAETVSIRGFINSQEFICGGPACVVYLDSSSKLVFHAFSESGAVSEDIIASVCVSRGQNGFIVTIDSVSQFSTFQNACSRAWGVIDE